MSKTSGVKPRWIWKESSACFLYDTHYKLVIMDWVVNFALKWSQTATQKMDTTVSCLLRWRSRTFCRHEVLRYAQFYGHVVCLIDSTKPVGVGTLHSGKTRFYLSLSVTYYQRHLPDVSILSQNHNMDQQTNMIYSKTTNQVSHKSCTILMIAFGSKTQC